MLGVGGIAVGAYIFFKPEVLIGMIPTVLGAVIFIDGIVKVQNAIDLSRMRYQYWWLILLLALLMSGVGICMILYPFEAYIKILMFTGICCIVNGVVDLCSILTLTHIIKKVQKQINQVDEVIEPEFIERPFDVKVDEYEEKNEVKQEVNEAVQEVNETVSEEPTVEIIEETEGEA